MKVTTQIPSSTSFKPSRWPAMTVEERVHTLVDLRAQPRHLALGDASHAHRLDQVVD
jgi:hypothetical protein